MRRCQRRGIMRHYTALLKPYRWWVVLALLMATLTVLANVGLMSTSAYLIARAAQHPYTILLLWVPIVGVRFFGTSRGVFRYLDRYVSHNVTFQLLKELRVYVYRKLEPLIPSRLQAFHTGDLLSRVVSDVDTLQNLYLGLYAPPIVALLSTIVILGLMAYFGVALALVLAVFLVLAGVVVPVLSQWSAGGLTARMVQARGELSTELVETIHGNTDLLVLGQEARHLEKLGALVRAWALRRIRLHWLAGLSAGIMQALNNGAMWLILVLGIGMVTRGALPPVLLPVVVLLTLASFEAVNALPPAFQMRGQISAARTRINEIVDQTPPIFAGQKTLEAAGLDGKAPAVQLHDVRFRYHSTTPWVLDKTSFDVLPMQHVAVVGPSGAGKSTLSGVLSQLWPYEEGHILINGVELSDLRVDAMPHLIGVVDQEPHLFDTTLRENLLLANPSATPTQLQEALRIAQLESLVNELPDGLETPVGEHGFNFSGGERKRVAIARVILQNAPILVFDEATEGLDALTERRLIQELRQWAKNKTVLWITHRLVNLDVMDQVVVLAQGRVVEQGPAETLGRQRGLFQRMRESEIQTFAWNADAV
ncbi:MAG: thiol reductant ABC exporter subunit CydC [Sulfobacillus thermosulfidooxidans]|nr:MAG: thiol reductant ABC exporter subunit CydC [Sulfobacillus thermosulfidooxidans]